MNEKRCFLYSLNLINYRCFPELILDFRDRLTVFVAPNGGGKTAVLDGVAVALRLFVDTMEGRPASKGFEAQDIRLVLNPDQKMEPVTPVRLEAWGMFLGDEIHWSRERQSEEASRTTTAEAWKLKQFATRLSMENIDWAEGKIPDPPLFPLVSYYGTGRLWGTMVRLTNGKKTMETAPNARHRGYTDCLSSISHYKYFFDWFRRFSYEAKKENPEEKDSPHEPQRILAAVRKAVDTAIAPSGWHGLQWDFAEDTIVAQHPTYGRLPVGILSDGIRNMIGMVADIAHRAARLNPHLGESAAIESPGIVLIDEVDMHLHPEWQQVVLQSLQQAFPLIQFIVTTHSPQVLSTVPSDCIRVLIQNSDGAWEAKTHNEQTRGMESAYVMATVMNTDSIPPVDEAQWVNDYHALIQQHLFDSPEAQDLRARLEKHFGNSHPVLLECDRMIRLERFKKTLPPATNRM